MNLVLRALPFQFTTAPGAKRAPYTFNVKSAPPGATAVGRTGLLTYGTGFAAAAKAVNDKRVQSSATKKHASQWEREYDFKRHLKI